MKVGLPVLTKMSSWMVVLSGILFLGQIYINSGENPTLKEKEQIQLLQTTNKVLRKYSIDKDQTNSTHNNSTLKTSSNCVFRIENGDHLIGVNKTREEIEKEGLTIFDEICEGDLDPNGDRISSGALASLCCG